MRARALPLPADEVAVRGRGAALAGSDEVAVHADAHGATGGAPLKAGGTEDAVEPFRFGGLTDQLGARPPHGFDARCTFPSLGARGRGAQIVEPAVGAGADE